MFRRAIAFWERYQRHISAGGLAIGFIFDLIIADRPDSLTNNLLLLSYLIIAGTLIIILNIRTTRKKAAEHSAEPLFLLLMLQFCFGGLASNLLVLYGRSGTLAGSALFLGILLAMLIANELLRTRYAQLRFNVGVYYLLILTYLVIAVPVFITHSIGTLEFLFSGLLSLVFISIFLVFLNLAVFRGREAPLRQVGFIVGTIFLSFNVLYFLNVIPPVPLSLKNIGIYHSVLPRSAGGYVALYEEPRWWELWRDTASTYIIARGGTAFCFSSVFAPTGLTTPVYHRWEKKDAEGKWITTSRVSFPITGGRDAGYRGWSTRSGLAAGQWRCAVETEQGALIGRIGITVVESTSTPALSQKIL